MSTNQYERFLWNEIDLLHERATRRHTYMNHFVEMMTKYQQACSNFSNTIKNILSKNYLLSDELSVSWDTSMKSITKCFSIFSQIFQQTSDSIRTTITEPLTKNLAEHTQKEKDTYNTYSKTRTIYNNLKISLDKAHKEFEQRAKDCENLVYTSKKAKKNNSANPEQISKMETKATEALTNTSMCEEKYMNLITEANKARENETVLQKKTHNFYETSDIFYYSQIKGTLGFLVTSLKQIQSSINMEADDLTDKFNRLNLPADIKDFINKNKVDAKPDPNIESIPYIPCPELSNKTKVNIKGQDSGDFDLKCEVVNTFKKYLKNIKADFNMDEEKKKNNLRNLIDNLLKTETNALNSFSKKELEDLLTQLKEPVLKSYFLVYLSKVKSKGLIEKERLFNDLKEIIIYILKLSEEINDYETAQNCIILSQTLYMQDKANKTKKYIIDYIRDYNWLNTLQFWEGIIELMIQKEILKNDEINKNKDEKEQKSNARNIVFSQVFSYSNNMIEFNINKEDIISMVEKFCREFEIEKGMIDAIVDNVNNMVNNKIKRKIEEEEEKKKLEEEKKKEEEKNKKEGKEKVEVIKDYFGSDN